MQLQVDDTGNTLCLSQFLSTGERWTAYIKRMRRSKQWGGHIEIVAAANMLEVTICIVTDQPEPNADIWIQPSHPPVTDDVLLLGFDSKKCHYHSLEGYSAI